MNFTYKAANLGGNIETGREEAESGEQLMALLKSRGLVPLEVKAESNSPARFWRKRFAAKERLAFTQQLSGLLNAGISLEKALTILSRITNGRELTNIINQLRKLIREGHSFTEALERFPRHFSPFYISMARSGETGGVLPEVLKRLAQYQEEEINLRNFIVSSLVYPVILGICSMGVLLMYVIIVLPKFQPIFQELGTDLPLVTRIIMILGNGIRYFWWTPIVVFIIGGIKLRGILATPAGRLAFDSFKIRIPFFGVILQKVAMTRLAFSLSMLTNSGVPLLSALGISGEVSGNQAFAAALREVVGDLKHGSSLIASMSKKPIIPPMAVEMIGVGEESGNLGEMLDQVAKNFDSEVKQSLHLFLAVFEPVLILMMVGFIAMLAIGILMPLFNLNSQIDPG